MKIFDTRTYSISDFIEWNSNGLLILLLIFKEGLFGQIRQSLI